MTTQEIIKMAAKTAGLNLKLEIPANDGVAIIGKLSEQETEMFNRYAVDAMAAGLHERYPAKIVKRDDGKAVDISNFLLVFTPQMLIEFMAEFVEQSKRDIQLINTPTAGNS